ncbi:MAG: 2-hydroxychromene-2-carboxylate isomerase [Comamonas sp.]|jgi:2-hydroxychromene-2-carboxylate isomerase|uniref:2-hydroxychromene-2-carboxylate isomerase n=1 Tax=Comamonas sp. TaxID=34028 RepID=UPI00281F386A|nr:2-hydroxychromene-2-carboxylate isomerase [Comamonas sp.]MDR0216069.1 2-hydroxychromene-2-carboxylate isomerase [Comamonas sp.]
MKHITCYLDFVSPYAWLAFAQLPEQLRGISCHVRYRPVLLGALLKQYANPGPAGIAPKRDWTYRHAQWLGHAQGTPLQMPQCHPFNPLPLLRLALECSDDGCINRFTAEAIFRHVWEGGADALAPGRLDTLRAQLTAQLRTDDQAQERAKALLRSNTEAAVAAGLFGVPSFVVDEHVFFGLDGLPMLRACLQGDAWFEQGWDAAAGVESGLG